MMIVLILSYQIAIKIIKENTGVIYVTSGTAGKSHYEIAEQEPFVAKQDDKHFGFLNIEINDKTVKGTFYANENENENEPSYYNVANQNNVIDHFTISKIKEVSLLTLNK